VPIIDVLGISDYFASSLQLLGQINDNLNTVNTHLVDIFDRLHHVEVDSYVNVRIMDELGDLPIPSTIATGLLVSVFAGEVPTVNVGTVGGTVLIAGNVNVTSFTSTTPIPIEGHVLVDNFPATQQIAGNVNVTNNPLAVSIVGTPAVSISGTPTVSISGIPAVSISGVPTVNAQMYGNDAFNNGNWSPISGTRQKFRLISTSGVLDSALTLGLFSVGAGIDNGLSATATLISGQPLGNPTVGNLGALVTWNQPPPTEELDGEF